MMLRIFAGSMLVVFVGAAGRGPFPAGTINGKVTYTGTPPKAHPIDMAKEPNCVTQHPTPVTTQDAVTGPGNSVRYVVVYIAVKCNVHPWMHGYFAVLATPHFSVTDTTGAFTLAGLPPGKYTVTAWHERFGTQSQEVTIGGAETKTVNFVLTAKPY